MLSQYKLYYRTNGVMKFSNLISPNFKVVNEMSRNAMLHYLTYDDRLDVDPSLPYLKHYERKINLNYVTETNHLVGQGRRKSVVPITMAGEFIRKNRQFRYEVTPEMGVSNETLMVVNYNPLKAAYAFVDMNLTDYNKWMTYQLTIWNNIDRLSKLCDAEHFVFVDPITDLPSLSQLKTLHDKEPLQLSIAFDTPDKRMVLHLWMLLQKELRERSVFNALSDHALSKTSLVFQTQDGRATVINLGFLLSWVQGNPNTSFVKKPQQQEETLVYKGFLKFLMILTSFTPDVAETVDEHPTSNLDSEDRNEQADRQDIEDGDEDEEDTRHYSNVRRISPSAPEPLPEFKDTSSIADTADVTSLAEELDADLAELEESAKIKLINKGMKVVDAGLVKIDQTAKPVPTAEEIRAGFYKTVAPTDSIASRLERMKETGEITAADYRRAKKDIEAYRSMKDPYGSGNRAIEAAVISAKDMELRKQTSEMVKSPTVFDESMGESVLGSYTRDYINDNLKKHILKVFASVQKGDVALTKHEIEFDNSVMGSSENHRIELKPLRGKLSPLWIKIPVIQEDGTYVANGNKYHFRKQTVDAPIRSIRPDTVELTSYYGKTFVTCGTRKSSSTLEWLFRHLDAASLGNSEWITDVIPGDTFDTNRKAPYMYNAISTRYQSFKAGDTTFYFNGKRIRQMPSKSLTSLIGEHGRFVGENETAVFYMGENNQIYKYEGGLTTHVGDIFTVLKLNPLKAPVPFSELQLMGRTVPVGIVLGFYLGISKLLSLMEVKPREVEPRKQLNLEPDEYPVVFKNKTYVFNRKDRLATLIFGGFMEYSANVKRYDLSEFDNRDVYMNLMTAKGMSTIHLRELDNLKDYFVDPITEEILEKLKEPVTFDGLLVRASEMLLKYESPKSQDSVHMRVRGYERIAGAIYKELTTAIRSYRNRSGSARAKIDMSPWEVWRTIDSDQSAMMVQDINPIQDVKMDESITYVGLGGRNKDAINKASRAMLENDPGVVSEATVDSSDVGVNNYLSANPQLADMYGLRGPVEDTPPSSLLSTAALLAPGVMHDDMNRVIFVSIQQSHTIAATGYHPPYVGTGYESMIAQRNTSTFAYAAKDDGKVVSVKPKGIIVEYKDGRRTGVPLGRIYGRAEGSIYPHSLVSKMVEGQTFKKGEIITYNENFFTPDVFNPGGVVMKNSVNARVALWEVKNTWEDASSISRKLAAKLGTSVVKERSVVVSFKDEIHELKDAGTMVGPKDPLLVIEDEITSGGYDDASASVLRGIASQAPPSNYLGKVERIEVYYHGQLEDMSPSLRKIAAKNDSMLSSELKAVGKPVYTGKTTEDWRVDGTSLGIDKAEIRFYINTDVAMGVTDKVVFANQMKSVVSETMDYTLTTESGDEIDATFGCRSIAARNVMSPYIIGTTATLLRLFAKEAVRDYKGTK